MSRCRDILASCAHTLFRPICRPFLRAPHGTRNVLFASHSTLTASYLAEIWELVRNDPSVRCYLTLQRPEHHRGDWSESKAQIPVPEIPQWSANLQPWDLVVMADHAGAFLPLATPWRHPVLRISHGIGGKRIDGEDYFYGSRIRDRRARLIYTQLFESSESRRDQAIASEPNLKAHIAVVGSLRADKLTAAAEKKKIHRASQRIPTVLIASSWGQGNLFSRFDEALIAAAEPLKKRYRFVLRPHPHLLRASTSGGRNWQAVFDEYVRRGFAYSPPSERLVDAVSDADVVVVDDLTSVGLLAVLAGVKVVVAPSGSESAGRNTFLVRLRDMVPALNAPTDLDGALSAVTKAWPPAGLSTLLNEMNSEPGRSEMLMRREVYRLLRLDTPVER